MVGVSKEIPEGYTLLKEIYLDWLVNCFLTSDKNQKQQGLN